MTITCGVPQGPILRPVLFLLYLALTCDKIMAVLFGNDTNLFITDKNLHKIAKTMDTEIIKVNLWLRMNQLSRNVFSSKHRITHTITITLDNKLFK